MAFPILIIVQYNIRPIMILPWSAPAPDSFIVLPARIFVVNVNISVKAAGSFAVEDKLLYVLANKYQHPQSSNTNIVVRYLVVN